MNKFIKLGSANKVSYMNNKSESPYSLKSWLSYGIDAEFFLKQEMPEADLYRLAYKTSDVVYSKCEELLKESKLLSKFWGATFYFSSRYKLFFEIDQPKSEEGQKGISFASFKALYQIDNKETEDFLFSVSREAIDYPVIQHATPAYNGISFIPKIIHPTRINLLENYNDEIVEVYPKIVEFFRSDKAGIVIFTGSPGQGKTMLIRHLLTEITGCKYSDNIYYCEPKDLNAVLMYSPNPNCTIICEDAENILQVRSSNSDISNLLNSSSGLLADSKRPKILFTTNIELGQIDSAILRKGRLYGSLIFEKLEARKADELLIKMERKATGKAQSLADLYNDYSLDIEKNKKVMGFK